MHPAAQQNGQQPRQVSAAANFFAAVNSGQAYQPHRSFSVGSSSSQGSNDAEAGAGLGRSQSMKNPPRNDGPLSFAAAGAGLQSPPPSTYTPPAAARHPLFAHHARPPQQMQPWSPALSFKSDPGPVPPITIDPQCQTPPSPGSTTSSAFSPATAFLQAFSSRSSAPSEVAPDAQGARVLDYTLGKVLGRGGFSTVRAATHIRTGEVFACKIVTRDDLSDESGSAARFEDEIRIWQTLPSHPAILPLLEMHRTEYATFMIMPCLEGSLLDVLRIEGGSESTARKWFPGCVTAVSALHEGFEGFEGHMMHGDLKLDNFLVDSHGSVCVGDFGMAHKVEAVPPKRGPSPANRPSNLPAHLQVRGRLSSAPDSPRNPSRSPARRRDTLATTEINQPGHQPCPSASLPYASPELLHASPAGPSLAQDIWALGIILHALLTGRLPFNDSFDPRLQMKILRGQWEEPYVGHEWIEALHGTLHRDPVRRWDIRRVRESDAVTGWREVRAKSRSRSRARVPDRGRRTPGDSPIHAHHPDGAGRGRDRSRSRPSPHIRHDSRHDSRQDGQRHDGHRHDGHRHDGHGHDDGGRFLHAQDGARSRSQSGTRKPSTPSHPGSRPGSMHRTHPHPEALAAELDSMTITRGRSKQRAQRSPNSSAESGDRVASRSPSQRPARPLSGAEQRRGRSRAREAAVPGTAGWWEAQFAHTHPEATPPGSGTHSGAHSGAQTPPREPRDHSHSASGSRPPTLGFELDVVDENENAPARGRAGGAGGARSKSRGRLDRL